MVSVSRRAGPPQHGQVVLTHSVWRGQRAFAVLAGFKVGDLGQAQRQLAFGQGLPAALVAVNHRDRFAPVALAAEHPVPQLEVDLLVAGAVFFQPGVHFFLGVLDRKAVEEAGIDQRAGGDVGESGRVQVRGFLALDNFHNGQAEFFSKFPVAAVVGGHGHDRAGAVGGEDIVRNEDGHALAVDRVDGFDALDAHASLFLVELGALKLRLAGGFLLVGGDGFGVFDKARVHPLFEERMLGRDDHIGAAEQRVGAGWCRRSGYPPPWWQS